MLALAGLLALVVAPRPRTPATLKPCADSPTARCGTITVPAVRSDPSAGTMQISFRRYPALGGRALHTLLAIEGGPGYPSRRLRRLLPRDARPGAADDGARRWSTSAARASRS